MSDRVIKYVEGNPITRSGSMVCPSPDKCDRGKWERHEAYVERHCSDHGVDMAYSDNAERNLGLWCFYYDHKYNWGNPTLTPQPFWEMHNFMAVWSWSESALESNKPMKDRAFRIPEYAAIKDPEYRRMKQVEVPRNCEKTSSGARAYSVFRSKHEYFVNDKSSYRIIIRSATGKNTRDTLAIIRRQASKSPKINQLYGIWMGRCDSCGRVSQHHERFSICQHEDCQKKLKKSARRLGLVNEWKGAGAYGQDMVSFRWLTDAAVVDAVAAYSIWVAGLESETTGQRPDLYIWDDPQTDKNSDTVEKRAKIIEKFDESVRQLEIPGELLVLDTRKYVDDFAGKIQQQPLNSLFWTLHRRVKWPTTEPDDAPFVVGGFRYYYPVKGNGQPSLNASEVERLERQMVERKFSAEYMNDPLDPTRALFKRDYFRVIEAKDAPPEVRFGLGRAVTPQEQQELDALGLRIHALNGCDPASKEVQSRKGDDSFIVGIRTSPRFQAVYVTYLAAGKWTASRTWDEIERANSYNRPQLTDYEMPNDEKHVRASFEKWARERAETVTEVGDKTKALYIPMHWSHMPKSGKDSRIEHSEPLMKNGGFFILANAGPADLIEKYIGQWVGYGVSDHDDGPDITSRLITRVQTETWNRPAKAIDEPVVSVTDGVAAVPVSLIKEMAITVETGALWGEQGW